METMTANGRNIELVPARCFTCGIFLPKFEREYTEYLSQGYSLGDALTKVGLTKYCCRGNIMNPIVIPIGAENPPMSGYQSLSFKQPYQSSSTGALTQVTQSESKPTRPSRPGTIYRFDQKITISEVRSDTQPGGVTRLVTLHVPPPVPVPVPSTIPVPRRQIMAGGPIGFSGSLQMEFKPIEMAELPLSETKLSASGSSEIILPQPLQRPRRPGQLIASSISIPE